MKYDHLPIVFILTLVIIDTVFENVTVASDQSQEYDPLQPVWNSIEQLSSQILQDMQQIMTSHGATMNNAINNQIQDFKNHHNSIVTTQSTDFEDDYDTIKNSVVEYLTANIHDLYYSRIMHDEQEALLSNSHNTIKNSLSEVEKKVSKHVDQTIGKIDFLFEFNDTLSDNIGVLKEDVSSFSSNITEIDRVVIKIRGTLMSPAASDTWVSVGHELERFLSESQPSQERLQEFEREWDLTYQAVVVDTSAVFFDRDCSDILWANPNATSGVYKIYPSRDVKKQMSVWCDMETPDKNGNVGGWTVILRRQNNPAGLLNFNRSWEEYSDGFGEVSIDGEWWLGLTWIHELTYYQPYQVKFLLHDIERGDFEAQYSTFRIEDETRNFRLIVDGFSGTVSDAFKSQHHGKPFSTPDRDQDNCDTCNCALNNQGGWWFNKCHYTVLTSPFPTSKNRDAKTIRWLSGDWLVLDDVTMMIRPTNYNKRPLYT